MMHHVQSVELIQTRFEKLFVCAFFTFPCLLYLSSGPVSLYFPPICLPSSTPLHCFHAFLSSSYRSRLLSLCSCPLPHSLSTSSLTLARVCWQSSVERVFCWSWDFSSSWDQWDPDMSQQPLMKKEKCMCAIVCEKKKELEKVLFYHGIKNVLGKMHPHTKQYVRT